MAVRETVYADAAELAALIRDPAKVAGKDYLVVDVRDEPEGGHIVGRANLASKAFLEDPQQFDQVLLPAKVLYFHCNRSKGRGPKCAIRYLEHIAGTDNQQEIKILTDGFAHFKDLYKDEPGMASEKLVRMMKDPTKVAGRDYLVVDGGHIKGSIHVPSLKFLAKPMDYLDAIHGPPIVFFHCAESMVRAPKCAYAYVELLSGIGIEDEQSVFVLGGGFNRWQQLYKSDPDLVVDFDQSVWSSGF
eukprot:jgi/Hompol1/1959/HPOL_000595-RA